MMETGTNREAQADRTATKRAGRAGAGLATRGPAGDGPPGGAPDEAIAALGFDAALAELGEVVGRLEAGGLPLETSIALYERGVALHAQCARLLDDAELRVQRLVEEAGGVLRAIDLSPDDSDDEGTPSA